MYHSGVCTADTFFFVVEGLTRGFSLRGGMGRAAPESEDGEEDHDKASDS
ncbi:hypothetical protein GCWU000342_00958 [Shuttleworthella satelles DSM 14600]|uniref:Uncharacterized protein n=1 Tax=Shuttleworthella satelles DSM 14600 TaxID=626523 RepID=C4GAK7_9FIRM|nr:hypothetical protein GCWU000342_00958 [Shuttleworthia satelles DSM 14600]